MAVTGPPAADGGAVVADMPPKPVDASKPDDAVDAADAAYAASQTRTRSDYVFSFLMLLIVPPLFSALVLGTFPFPSACAGLTANWFFAIVYMTCCVSIWLAVLVGGVGEGLQITISRNTWIKLYVFGIAVTVGTYNLLAAVWVFPLPMGAALACPPCMGVMMFFCWKEFDNHPKLCKPEMRGPKLWSLMYLCNFSMILFISLGFFNLFKYLSFSAVAQSASLVLFGMFVQGWLAMMRWITAKINPKDHNPRRGQVFGIFCANFFKAVVLPSLSSPAVFAVMMVFLVGDMGLRLWLLTEKGSAWMARVRGWMESCLPKALRSKKAAVSPAGGEAADADAEAAVAAAEGEEAAPVGALVGGETAVSEHDKMREVHAETTFIICYCNVVVPLYYLMSYPLIVYGSNSHNFRIGVTLDDSSFMLTMIYAAIKAALSFCLLMFYLFFVRRQRNGKQLLKRVEERFMSRFRPLLVELVFGVLLIIKYLLVHSNADFNTGDIRGNCDAGIEY
eukprot:PLAT3609.1.p1 GENE.PLAT3609.1~~PLAT3609.1.p1  ORF type:complete len:530 (+),score=203.92 PLAT3609.1:75-1592(+)